MPTIQSVVLQDQPAVLNLGDQGKHHVSFLLDAPLIDQVRIITIYILNLPSRYFLELHAINNSLCVLLIRIIARQDTISFRGLIRPCLLHFQHFVKLFLEFIFLAEYEKLVGAQPVGKTFVGIVSLARRHVIKAGSTITRVRTLIIKVFRIYC